MQTLLFKSISSTFLLQCFHFIMPQRGSLYYNVVSAIRRNMGTSSFPRGNKASMATILARHGLHMQRLEDLVHSKPLRAIAAILA